jgi:hypothetical protein
MAWQGDKRVRQIQELANATMRGGDLRENCG